jgi:hypothetical protein
MSMRQLWLIVSSSLLTATSLPPAECEFTLRDAYYEGSCGSMFDAVPRFKVAAADSITSGRWRPDMKPTSVWSGEVIFPPPRNGGPIEIESYADGTGVVRTDVGWFPISHFRLDAGAMRFRLDPTQQAAPSEFDRQIIERAAALISTEARWDRADDRVCHPTDTTWSIYCALRRATIDVTGGFHHRRPALEIVRIIVEQRTAGRNYSHRLMDYNNDRTTRLEDLRSLFAEARAQLR